VSKLSVFEWKQAQFFSGSKLIVLSAKQTQCFEWKQAQCFFNGGKWKQGKCFEWKNNQCF
jgi:hypothetical protein